MKRFLIALFAIFTCGKTFATVQAPIFVFADVLEYAIKKNFSMMDYDAVAQEWEKRMSADGTVTATDIETVCKIGRLDKNACTKFRDDLMTYFYPVCEKSATKGQSICVDDFWVAIRGTWVRLSEAIGIAQEYAQLKNKETVVCSPKTRQVNPPARASYLKCTSVDGEHFYEFKFNSTTETNDRDIISGTLRAIGKMHNIEFQNADCSLERIASDSNCALAYKTSDTGQCEKINNSLKRFGYSSKIITSEKFGRRCEVFGITGGNRTAYNIDNTVFQDVQYVAGPDVEKRIKAYVQKELSQQNIKLEKFSCDKSTKHNYTNIAMDGLIKKHNEILTCYINGSPIDFLFADLSENKDYAKNAGLSKMACIQLGGKVDQKKCRGLDEQECNKLGNRLIARGEQGTKYLQEKGGCILNSVATELAINLAKEIVAGIAITVVTDGAATIPVIVSIGTDLAFEAVQIWQDEIPYKDFKEFIAATEECENLTKDDILGNDYINDIKKYCMGNVLNKYSKLMDTEMKDLAPDVVEQLIQKMTHIKNIVGDESILYINKSKISIGKQARNYASFALFGGLMIFNPEKWGSKSKTMIKEFSKLQLKASEKFATKLNRFINTGELEAFPVERLTRSEWEKLNTYLEPYGVELVDYKINNGVYKKLFFRETASTPSIFSKIYDDMPKEILNQKLNWLNEYIKREGFSTKTAIEGLDKVGAFDIKRASKLADDLAIEITQKLAIRPDIIERSKNWRKLDSSARKQLVLELQDIITTTRRPHIGNTIVDFNPRPGTSGSHSWNGSQHKFRYTIETDNFADVLNTIIHENTHSFQAVYKSSIPDIFLDLADKVYTSDNPELYRKTLEEQEAWFIGGAASKTVLQNFGLPYKTYIILGISVAGMGMADNLSD